MEIDISFLNNKSTVVWCRTFEEANILMKNVTPLHQIIERDLIPKVERFEDERDVEGLGFRFDHLGSSFDIGYATMDYYRENDYNIVELRNLIVTRDYGEIDVTYSDACAALAALF